MRPMVITYANGVILNLRACRKAISASCLASCMADRITHCRAPQSKHGDGIAKVNAFCEALLRYTHSWFSEEKQYQSCGYAGALIF